LINASFSGELICFANDADALYSNNKVGGWVCVCVGGGGIDGGAAVRSPMS
jgi:hypothetical protein